MMNKLQLLRSFLATCLIFSFITILVACSESSTPSAPSESWGEKHFLWKVSDENSSVWLLGSIHIADASFYPLPSVIDSAFATASELAVELNTSDERVMNDLQWQVKVRGELAGEKLRDVLPAELWNSLDSVCKSWGLPISAFETKRPWVVASTISTYAYMMAGMKTEYGIDNVFIKNANASGKPIISLETVEEQIDALAGYSYSDSAGICFLKSTMRELPKARTMMRDLVHAWKSGDDELLNLLLSEDNKEDYTPSELQFMEELTQHILVDRNANMADSVASFLRDDRNVFVVVGTAHLAFEKNNVIENLRNRGYIIERY